MDFVSLPNRSKFEFAKDDSTFSILCEKVRKLRLHNYPFGDGDWCSPDPYESNDPQLETVTQLKQVAALEKIYDYDNSWSTDIQSLRKAAIERPKEIGIKEVMGSFTTLRFTSPKLKTIDPNVRHLYNLQSLSFVATSSLDKIMFDHLPPCLQQLNVIACGLTGLSESIEESNNFPYIGLIHLGLAMNSCKSALTDHYLSSAFFPNLKSIDLSSNGLTNLNTFVKAAKSLKNLGALNLSGNPLCNFKLYQVALIHELGLTILDDRQISVEEKQRAQQHMLETIESVQGNTRRENVFQQSTSSIARVKKIPRIF